MKNKNPFTKLKLDLYEKELQKSLKAGAAEFTKDQASEAKTLIKAAKNTQTKNISIRIDQKTLSGFRKKAEEKGIPYQTLIKSVLHEYIKDN